jgi:hypothetical protein
MAGSVESTADEVAEELYALPPELFVAARDEQVRKAREAGDRDLATALGRLRRPTTSAWVVNLLVRDQPDLLDQLLSLGDELRAAQRELRGPALRDLAARRQRVISALVQVARRLAAGAGHPVSAATGFDVEQTLHAALADPDVARAVCGRRLVHPAAPTGFGDDAPAPPTAAAAATGSARASREPARSTAAAPPGKRAPAGGGSGGEQRGTSPDTDREEARERRAEERRRAERERLQVEHDSASVDQETAAAELGDADQRLAAAEAARDGAAARIQSLQEQLQAAQRDLHDASGAIREARRRRDVAARVHAGTAERLARLTDRLRGS